jgi:hypothetical protein
MEWLCIHNKTLFCNHNLEFIQSLVKACYGYNSEHFTLFTFHHLFRRVNKLSLVNKFHRKMKPFLSSHRVDEGGYVRDLYASQQL